MDSGERRGVSGRAAVLCIVGKETLDLLRDRRAVCFAFVLPLLTYPIFFLLASFLKESQEEELKSRLLRVAVVGDDARLSALLEAEHFVLETDVSDAEAVRDGVVDLFLRLEPQPRDGQVGDPGPEDSGTEDDAGERSGTERTETVASGADTQVAASLRVGVSYLATSPASQEARRRVEGLLDSYRGELLRERLLGRGVQTEPTSFVESVATDLASDEELSGASLGRILPMLLVMLLLTGGSFAALDLVAGEKERGTLETLFVHPVTTDAIVWGKLIVIFGASIVSVVLNLLGVYLSILVGRAFDVPAPGFGDSALETPPALTLGVVLILCLPLAALSSAVLLAVSAYARSFREAQMYLFPVTILAMIAVLPAASPLVTLESAVLVVPVAGVALAMREVLGGNFPWLAIGAVLCLTSLYAAVFLWLASALLKNEKVILGLEAPPLASDASGEGRERRGLLFGSLMLLLVYFAGSALQSWQLYAGLALTLWGVVLIPSLLYPRLVRLPAQELLGIRRTPAMNYVSATLIAASSLLLISGYMRVQSVFLPFPTEMEEFFRELIGDDDLVPGLRLLLFAVSPAICEELLWRGAFQGEVGARRRTVFTIVVVGIFFGLFHLSIYRVIPTGILGAILALVRIRAGSIFPCMLLHAVYNGLAVQYLGDLLEDEDVAAVLLSPAALAVAAVILAASVWAIRPSQRRQKAEGVVV